MKILSNKSMSFYPSAINLDNLVFETSPYFEILKTMMTKADLKIPIQPPL